jgi:hypothetical protein
VSRDHCSWWKREVGKAGSEMVNDTDDTESAPSKVMHCLCMCGIALP